MNYLDTVVIPRGSTKKQKLNADGSSPPSKPLSSSTIDKWVAAVISLYDTQKAMGDNSHPHPRGPGVRGILRKQLQDNHRQRRENYEDRGKGTMLDGYNVDDFKAIEEFWIKSLDVGGRLYISLPCLRLLLAAVRNRLDHLTTFSMTMRGQDFRGIQFADCFCVDLPEEGPMQCTILMVLLANGKTNQHGRIEYGAITELWLEYTEGIDGKMAPKEAERRYKAAWRSTSADIKLWSRRKKLINTIETLANRLDISNEESARRLEERRRGEQVGLNYCYNRYVE